MMPIPTLLAGTAFVALAGLNVVAMLEASRPACSAIRKRRLIKLHRICGYAFIVLLCVMVWTMIHRLVGAGLVKAAPYLVLHVVLALLLVPMMALKLIIARRFKNLHSVLMALGLAIFGAAFVLVALPVLSQTLRSATPEGAGVRTTLILAVVVSLFLFSLVASRTGRRGSTVTESLPDPVAAVAETPAMEGQVIARKHLTLRLTSIEQQTDDTKTLRFLVPSEHRFRAKPGQFLTFHWMIAGKQVLRSYTISSSPIHNDYVEITPKRVENGCVSTFLHDEARPGLTVEATGPHGKFYFDEMVHRSLVLIAAGSGITPMMAIVRYIDDLHLPTPVSLLYCVRSAKDIIFAADLERIQQSLPNFAYGVTLSKPDETWRGHRGHLTREFIDRYVPDLHAPAFFLCGPTGFMESARQILMSAGVDQSRIAEENFGRRPVPPQRGQPAAAVQAANEPAYSLIETIEFAASRIICLNRAGCSLLEVAEANGIEIPFGCRQGQCGTCASRLLQGSVEMETETGLSAEQKSAGYVLPCVSRVKTSVVLAA